jgi:hypothetical protein
MIFGWALLEETRPTPNFWKFLKVWTTVVLIIKFFYNIKWENILNDTENTNVPGFGKLNWLLFKLNAGVAKHVLSSAKSLFGQKQDQNNVVLSYLKLGTYSYHSLADLVWYVLPEVSIMSLLMINSIYLRLIGYKTLSELDIEDVTEGIDRVLQKGNIQKVNENKIMSYNMNLSHYFESRKT